MSIQIEAADQGATDGPNDSRRVASLDVIRAAFGLAADAPCSVVAARLVQLLPRPVWGQWPAKDHGAVADDLRIDAEAVLGELVSAMEAGELHLAQADPKEWSVQAWADRLVDRIQGARLVEPRGDPLRDPTTARVLASTALGSLLA